MTFVTVTDTCDELAHRRRLSAFLDYFSVTASSQLPLGTGRGSLYGPDGIFVVLEAAVGISFPALHAGSLCTSSNSLCNALPRRRRDNKHRQSRRVPSFQLESDALLFIGKIFSPAKAHGNSIVGNKFCVTSPGMAVVRSNRTAKAPSTWNANKLTTNLDNPSANVGESDFVGGCHSIVFPIHVEPLLRFVPEILNITGSDFDISAQLPLFLISRDAGVDLDWFLLAPS